MGMKKILITFFIAVVCIALISGCSGNGNNTGTAPTPSDRAESPEAVPTLDEVISGTWSLHAGYEQSGELAYVSSDSAEYTCTFDADNGFSGVYRQSDGYIDSTLRAHTTLQTAKPHIKTHTIGIIMQL